MSIWIVERQLTYMVEAETEQEALSLSRLVDPVGEIGWAWLEGEVAP